MVLITCVIEKDVKFYPQIFLEIACIINKHLQNIHEKLIHDACQKMRKKKRKNQVLVTSVKS